MSIQFRRHSVLPGFKLALGYTLLYLGLIVLVPLSGIFFKSSALSWGQFWDTVLSLRALASYRVTFGAALAGALINALFGPVVAWVLARYRFPGKNLVDALVDLPFALPTAVSGITLASVCSANGWLGNLLDPWGIKIAYTPLGIVVALTFIGLPFVVRTLHPVLEDLEREVEEAAASLGANRWQTFRRVIFPSLWPALLTGFSLAFARAVGEYGSVIFIAGNMPMVSEIAPLLIVTKLEQYDYSGATGIVLGTIFVSFPFIARELIPLMREQGSEENDAHVRKENIDRMNWVYRIIDVRANDYSPIPPSRIPRANQNNSCLPLPTLRLCSENFYFVMSWFLSCKSCSSCQSFSWQSCR